MLRSAQLDLRREAEGRHRSLADGVAALVKPLLNYVRSSNLGAAQYNQVERTESPRWVTTEPPGLGLLARPPSPSLCLQPGTKSSRRSFWIR